MTGGQGTDYSGDGGGWGGGGGGFSGGLGGAGGRSPNGGTHYTTGLTNITSYNGNSSASGAGGIRGPAVTVANATDFAYTNNYGAGGTPGGSTSGAGTQGIVIFRYIG
jgi:hypothetical protein